MISMSLSVLIGGLALIARVKAFEKIVDKASCLSDFYMGVRDSDRRVKEQGEVTMNTFSCSLNIASVVKAASVGPDTCYGQGVAVGVSLMIKNFQIIAGCSDGLSGVSEKDLKFDPADSTAQTKPEIHGQNPANIGLKDGVVDGGTGQTQTDSGQMASPPSILQQLQQRVGGSPVEPGNQEPVFSSGVLVAPSPSQSVVQTTRTVSTGGSPSSTPITPNQGPVLSPAQQPPIVPRAAFVPDPVNPISLQSPPLPIDQVSSTVQQQTVVRPAIIPPNSVNSFSPIPVDPVQVGSPILATGQQPAPAIQSSSLNVNAGAPTSVISSPIQSSPIQSPPQQSGFQRAFSTIQSNVVPLVQTRVSPLLPAGVQNNLPSFLQQTPPNPTTNLPPPEVPPTVISSNVANSLPQTVETQTFRQSRTIA